MYNGIVLPHLQYCLLVWGDFSGGRNLSAGRKLLKYQKRLVGMVGGKTGVYHADPLFAKYGVLKVEDLYRQQCRIHAWQFWNGCLPENQAAMFQRTSDLHTYSTRLAGTGLTMMTGDKRSMRYQIPKEWSSLPEKLKSQRSLTAFKRQSRRQFLELYKKFSCREADCRACLGGAGGR